MNEKEFDLGIVKRFFEHDYHDRGLMKWQGFYLSDHTAALNQQKIQDKQQYPTQATTVFKYRWSNLVNSLHPEPTSQLTIKHR
ncbi:hypothetical protein [Lactiplantibacillus plantarum]|uniref:hypothetical protein n=1 Tax=Lactiplantibacillus plantarum TaxID=1590 RepID=UPI003D340D00